MEMMIFVLFLALVSGSGGGDVFFNLIFSSHLNTQLYNLSAITSFDRCEFIEF